MLIAELGWIPPQALPCVLDSVTCEPAVAAHHEADADQVAVVEPYQLRERHRIASQGGSSQPGLLRHQQVRHCLHTIEMPCGTHLLLRQLVEPRPDSRLGWGRLPHQGLAVDRRGLPT